MPVYDYRCEDCGHDFVVVESLKEHDEHQEHEGAEQRCPECESANVERRISGVNIQTARKF